MCVKWLTPITNVVHGYVYFYVRLCTIIWNLYLDKFQFFTKCFKQQTYFFAAFFGQLKLDLIAAHQTV